MLRHGFSWRTLGPSAEGAGVRVPDGGAEAEAMLSPGVPGAPTRPDGLRPCEAGRRRAASLTMSHALRQGAIYLACGYVLFFASERLFWSVLRVGDHAGELAVTWLAYSALACVFLNVTARLRANTTPTVFVAGALYGWLTEGTLVGTLYGTEPSAPFPQSLVVTGLSWHALLAVLVCWHWLGTALRGPRTGPVLAVAAGVGIYWGAWAPFLWRETPPEVTTVPAFATHAFLCTALLMFSHGVCLRLRADSLSPGRFGLAISLALLGVFYSAQIKALGLRPLVVLPALAGIGLGLLVLARRRLPPAGPAVPAAAGRVSGRNLALLLVLPATATGLYAVQLALKLDGIAPVHFYRAGAVVSVALLGWSVFRILRPWFCAGPETEAG